MRVDLHPCTPVCDTVCGSARRCTCVTLHVIHVGHMRRQGMQGCGAVAGHEGGIEGEGQRALTVS